MKFYLISISFLITVINFRNVFVEARILDLNKDNFREVTASSPYLLVEFYAPWCPYCKEFAPEYQKADTVLQHQNSPVKFARVDATTETDLAEENGVRGYPTIKFYRYGYSTEYDGSRTASDLVDWLNMKTK